MRRKFIELAWRSVLSAPNPVSMAHVYNAGVLKLQGMPLPEQVAYVLNIRGSDVAHCPVAISYALITPDGASLFVDQSKVSPEVKAEMKVEYPFAKRLLSIDTMICFCGSL